MAACNLAATANFCVGANTNLTAMPIYRIQQSGVGQLHSREWRRRVLHTVGLLLLVVTACAVGLIALDSTGLLLPAKVLRGVWNALNMVTTLGAFTSLDPHEKLFLMATMVAFMLISGYALSSLTGILSSDAVMALRENRKMEHKLDGLANHVIVIGFGELGQLVAERLHEATETVVVIDRSDELAAQASSLGYLVVQGDAGVDDAALDRSRVGHAKALVVTTEDADRKLSITLMAHSRNPKLKIVVTGRNSPRGALLNHAGASEVVITDDLIAGALVDRLKKGGDVKRGS
jgi:voltage-gated potassium channel